MAAEKTSRRLVHSTLAFLGWVLDESHDSVGHEATAADGVPGPGHLRDLDDATPGRDLDAPPGSRGDDLEPLYAASAGVHQDLYSVAFHLSTDATAPSRPAAGHGGGPRGARHEGPCRRE